MDISTCSLTYTIRWHEFNSAQLSAIINMNILEREKAPSKPQPQPQQQQEQLTPECVDTKLIVWEDDQFEEFQVDFLNQVYPEKIHKDTMSKGSQFVFHFLSSSLYYWVELKDEGEVEPGKLSSKDWKFIHTSLQEKNCQNFTNYNRWGKQFMKRQQFHKKQSEQAKFRPPQGQLVHSYNRGTDKFTLHRYVGSDKQFIRYKQRFQILFLLYIDGVSFVEEETDQWEYYVIYKQKEERRIFVGALSKYIFKLTSVKERHRISQVFIMPAFQKSGHGKELIDYVYKGSLQLKTCFQITTEAPSFEYQCLRDYKELELIMGKNLLDLTKLPSINNKEDIENAQQEHLLTKETLRSLKQSVKLPGNQIQRLIHILIYAKIQAQPQNELARAYFQQFIRQKIIFNRSAFKSRKKVPHITFQGETADMKQFFLQKAKQDYTRNQDEIQQVLTETLDGFRRVIAKLTKNGLIKFI